MSFVSSLAGRAKAAVTGAKAAAATGSEQASAALAGAREKVSAGYSYMQLGAAGLNVSSIVDMKAMADAGYGLAGAQLDAAKRNSKGQLFNLGAPIRAKVMFALKCSTQESATCDPDMCDSVKTKISDLIDVFWDDLTVFTEKIFKDEELKARGQLVDTWQPLSELGKDTAPTFMSPRWWRAFILYRMVPFDYSVFGQLKDPVWWLLTAITLVTFYGIRVAFFTIFLLFILLGCPPDEYQLVAYILGFKGSQFISSGVIQAIVASVRYYLCVHPDGKHTCDTDGPGANQDIVSGLVDLLGSCILTWVAFLALPYSESHGGVRTLGKIKGDVEVGTSEGSRGCCGHENYDTSKGGRLAGLLHWDVFAFVLSCLFTLLLMYVDASHVRPGGENTERATLSDVVGDSTNWEGRTAIFWGRIFYAFMSAPFVVFLIPGLGSVLTHTSITGYNKYGYAVVYSQRPDENAKEK